MDYVSIMRLTMTAHLERGDLGMSYGPLPWEVNMLSYRMQRCPHSVKRIDTTWGISGDVCVYISVLFSTGTLTTIV
jgi:hypothetical protein